jgi:CheY-like chemotaxis protein
LSSTTWKGANLLELIQDQLCVGAIDETRLAAGGPHVLLAPQAALHLALILHELTTNANKYGALSAPQGRIALTWTIRDEMLCLSWVESGGPAVSAPAKRGFGTRLIEQSVKAEDGAAHASYRADGMSWDISLSLPRVTAAPTQDPMRFSAGGWRGTAAARTEAGAVGLAGRRFLIVEDEALVVLDLVNILEDADAEIAGVASTAEQALEMIGRLTFDAALLDGNLHGRPVDEIAAALTRRKAPFAFVTGYGNESLPRAFRHVGMIAKPFTPHKLREAAQQLLAPAADVVNLRNKA